MSQRRRENATRCASILENACATLNTSCKQRLFCAMMILQKLIIRLFSASTIASSKYCNYLLRLVKIIDWKFSSVNFLLAFYSQLNSTNINFMLSAQNDDKLKSFRSNVEIRGRKLAKIFPKKPKLRSFLLDIIKKLLRVFASFMFFSSYILL